MGVLTSFATPPAGIRSAFLSRRLALSRRKGATSVVVSTHINSLFIGTAVMT